VPKPNQAIGSTAAKTGTFQYNSTRIQGIPLKFGPSAGVTSVPNNRIVSLQVDAANKLFAVVGNTQLASHTLIGWGVLEEALQSGGVSSIAPTPNNYVAGDLVTVLRSVTDVYMIDYDTGNAPAEGIGLAYVDDQGRLSSVNTEVALKGAVFSAVPGIQLAGQLKDGCKFYQMGSPTIP
jgi:hypothetical protein